ncbi:MAG: 30S ribosomal protein S7, partial [Candidatus Omnitrophota bacterium]
MRRRKPERKPLAPDLKYNSKSVERMINMVMVKGKKSKAQGIVYGALDIITKKTQKNDCVEV